MKKIITAAIITLAPFFVHAQDINLGGGTYISGELIRICASILVLYLVITFILTIIKAILEFRLKSKLVEKGVSDKLVEQFLQPTNKDAKTQAIKVFLILAGIGIGLAIINFTLPIGVHSFAIMAFSMALSFLGYYFFINWSNKQSGRE